MSHQQRHHPYHHHHHNHNDSTTTTTTTATAIDVITLDDDNNNHNADAAHYCPLRPTTSKGASSSSSYAARRQARSPAAAIATATATIVDRDYCVLIAEYTRDELERTRCHEQQHREQQQQQQQQLADAHVLTTRVMTAYSALEERYETCTVQLAESREESEAWRDDLGRFGRRQYEERRAATLQQTTNAATIAELSRELEDARHTIVRHTIAQRNNNNNNNNMMCPVCLEAYVDLAATSNKLFTFCFFFRCCINLSFCLFFFSSLSLNQSINQKTIRHAAPTRQRMWTRGVRYLPRPTGRMSHVSQTCGS